MKSLYYLQIINKINLYKIKIKFMLKLTYLTKKHIKHIPKILENES